MFKASNAVARALMVDADDHAFTACVDDQMLCGIVRILGNANQALDGPRDLCDHNPMDHLRTIGLPIVFIIRIIGTFWWRGSAR